MTNEQQPITAELREMAQEALRLAKGATEGPWVRSTHGFQVLARQSSFSVVEQDLTDRLNNTRREMDVLVGNAQFVAESRQLVPDLATALLAALDREVAKDAEIAELKEVSRTARQAVYHCTLATGIGYWQELANAVFELEADDRE